MEVIILGAGGFAKQAIEAFELSGSKIKGLLDDGPVVELLGYPILGKIESLSKILSPHDKIFCGIGNVQTRKLLFYKFPNRWVNCIHPNANISKYSTIGHGNYIGPGVCIMPKAIVGNNNILDCSTVISHDSVVGDHNHLAANSCLLGNVRIENCNLIGANSTILPGKTMISNNILGAGAVLTKSIDSNQILTGIPAKSKEIF